MAKLFCHQEIERKIEMYGEVITNRHTTPRNGQYHALIIPVFFQVLSQLHGGVKAIDKIHNYIFKLFCEILCPTKYCSNQSAASCAALSRVPGSSNKCDAPGTISIFFLAVSLS